MSWQSLFLILGVVICWGSTPIIEKQVLKTVDPLLAVFVRAVSLFSVFFLFFLFTGKIKEVTTLPLKTVGLIALGGILAGGIGMCLYFLALKVNPSSKVVPLASVYPLFTMILAFFLLKENVTWHQFLGTILIISGILLVK